MPAPATLRRLATHSLAGALLALAGSHRSLAAQEGCVFGEEGNDVLDQQTVPGGGTITYVTRPHFVCADGVQIWADSAVAYSADALSHLIGAVRYLDGSRELTAAEARYFSNVGRLQAAGEVFVVDREDGSRVENGDLVYLRRTGFRAEESMTVTTGADGVRPRATMPPRAADSLDADPRVRTPYTVVGDRIVFRGSSYFSSTGDVEIVQDSLFAFADSAEYEEALDELVLVGSARVESGAYDLMGRTIILGTTETETTEIRAVEEAVLTGEDLRVTAPEIRVYVSARAVQRLVAVPLASIPSQSDSSAAERPVALAERFELTADSLELNAPAEIVDRIFAAGRARSVSHARDSLNVEALPGLARQDWLEGDTIVVSLMPTRSDSLAPTVGEGGTERAYEVEQIVARVRARSLYRLPPEDSTAIAGVDLPAVHYVVGDEITIHMNQGEVEAMDVVGQTRGVHLEPLGKAAEGSASDTTAADDSGGGRTAAPGRGANPVTRP